MLLMNESINFTIPLFQQESSKIQYVNDIKTRNNQQLQFQNPILNQKIIISKLIQLFQELPKLQQA